MCLALAYGVCFVIKAKKSAELKELEKYTNDPNIVAQVSEYDVMYDNMAEMGEIQGGVDILQKDINSYPIPDSSINDKILEAAKNHDVSVEFNSYNSESGIFSITASSPDVEDINIFIADLMSMDVFENVDYTGYSINSTGTRWEINVVCTLAGREPAVSEVIDEEAN